MVLLDGELRSILRWEILLQKEFSFTVLNPKDKHNIYKIQSQVNLKIKANILIKGDYFI